MKSSRRRRKDRRFSQIQLRPAGPDGQQQWHLDRRWCVAVVQLHEADPALDQPAGGRAIRRPTPQRGTSNANH